MTDTNPNQNVACLLHDTARLLRRGFNRRAQRLGLTQAQWQALAVLSHNQGMNQAALADMLEVQPISVARLLDRLEANGWVERRDHPHDRRSVMLYLTEKAEPILEQMCALAEETQQEALAGISTADRDELVRIVCQIKNNLLEIDEAQTSAKSAAAAGGQG